MGTTLVVAYHYPPEEGSCSEKNVRVVKKLTSAGHKVIVLTKSYKYINSIENEDGVMVVRTTQNGIFHKAIDANCVEMKSKTSSSSRKSQIARKVSSRLIPDSTVDWITEVKKLYNNNKNLFEKCDLILSISSPYSAHIASRFLAKKLNIPYVLCYGDPWIYEPKRKRGIIRYLVEKKIEKKLVKEAAKILVITEWNKKKYIELYGINSDKVLTYHIGYDEDEHLKIQEKAYGNTLNIIYGGSLDKVHRNPQPFIEAMAKVEGIKAYIYNSDNEDVPKLIKQYGVQDKVILNPIINSKEFYKKLYEMDALLLFGNKTPFQVPGKVFTYISTRKKILYLKNNNYADDGTEEVLNSYGNAIIVNNDQNEIVHYLLRMKSNDESALKVNAEQFEFHNTMQSIIEALKQSLCERG